MANHSTSLINGIPINEASNLGWQQAQGIDGSRVQKVLESVHIAANKNTVPGDVLSMAPGGIRMDHATGLAVGETTLIGNNVSILHNVTLGGTGKASGDRHLKIGDGVLIGPGTCILGNIKIGDGAKIGACSVMLKEVPPRTTVVGNPARVVGGKDNPIKLDKEASRGNKLKQDHNIRFQIYTDDKAKIM
ncbi:Serine acetyltransferase 3, mitochondrial [Glycine soja]|uniref:serine O-acetyltransferase n=1 Tax=Glycine soja TaxID=3848 RepID=A0A0B2SFK2_GLYSO|nr:Serine acetyltransferase 3, mitochondrial [Glycine soja]